MNDLIAAIVSRTRDHPGIVRGTSVRGAIAFKEVLQSFKEMQGVVTPGSIEKAALITLPPRISIRQGGYGSAEAIVREIVRQVLYGIQYPEVADDIELPEMGGVPSTEEILGALKNLEPAYQEQDPELAQKGPVAIIPDESSSQEEQEIQHSFTKKTAEHLVEELEQEQIRHPFAREATEQLMEELERKLGRGEITKDEYHREKGGLEEMLGATSKAMEHLMEGLGQKLRRGEITEDEYHREKGRLEEMSGTPSEPRYQMSSEELSGTVMELMDSQDKQWEKEVSLDQMYIYYHVKSTCEGNQLNPPKRSYYGLRALIDDLEKRGILKAAAPGRSPTLTAEALNTLLEHLIPKARRGRELEGMIDSGTAQASERKHEIRRYSLGDVFRDISVRHTLREIARQKKKLSDVSRREFRVYMKQGRRLQSDIVLCVDTSGSMGFRQKLTYARVAAASLVRTAIENRDRVGIVAFDDSGKTIMPLSDGREALLDYVARINAGGNTNIGDGIKCAAQLLLKQPSRNQKYIVLITDGQPTAISERAFGQLGPTKESDVTEEYAILEARRASSRGVKVSVVHITSDKEAGEKFVKNITSAGKGQVVKVSCLDDLKAIV